MKKVNILNLFFINGANFLYPHWWFSGILLVFVLFFLNGCFSIFRPTPVLEEDKSETLKADNQFILLNEDLTPVQNPDFTNLDKKVKSLQKVKSFHGLNN